MKKSLLFLLGTTLISTSLFGSKHIKDPQVLFTKKCQICHLENKPKDKTLRKKMAGPPIKVVMKNLIIGVDVIEEPKNEKELYEKTIAFMEDYFFAPSKEKAYCEDISFNKFGMMPSMKGFMTKEQVSIVAPWVLEKFGPVKDEKGEWKARP